MHIIDIICVLFYNEYGDNMRGKLILIEGTDCSGKETQTKLLLEKLSLEGIICCCKSFPSYASPTGKIVGGPYLGKSYISECWFPEGAVNVDPKVASLYYAADRKYNIGEIEAKLNEGTNVILDRYVYSNLAHQGGKIKDKKERYKMYDWLDKLEFGLLELPHADIKIFLHMPYEAVLVLKQNREEVMDQHETSREHLIASENAFKEIASLYNFKTIECSKDNKPRPIEEIGDELYEYIKSQL